ncbi:MAG TPA: ABC transporter ATP-binding protein [Acidimicrobiales bacterium]|nr:ABC transporter ATP-binding protein [Acidimicrobiales bacterium]
MTAASPVTPVGERPPKLAVRAPTKRFPSRDGDTLALDGVDLEVPAGGFVSLVGVSGCGKSTLLGIVAGLEPPTPGTVTVDGDLLVGPGPDRGVVFQAYSLFPWRTVAENVAFGLECLRVGRAERRRRVAEMLGVVGLSEFAGHLPRERSGGMRQRVAIARALVTEPDVLLLDEPFGALDLQTRRSLHEFLRQVWQRTGATVLMVTHDVGEAVYLSERVVVMTSRPGTVADVVEVPFGRSRGPEVRRDERFLALEDEIDDLLRSRRSAFGPSARPARAGSTA